MKLDLDAYNEIKDRLRKNLLEMESQLEKFPEIHNKIMSNLVNLKSLISQINNGDNGWQVRSMEDDFNE